MNIWPNLAFRHTYLAKPYLLLHGPRRVRCSTRPTFPDFPDASALRGLPLLCRREGFVIFRDGLVSLVCYDC